jgi:hypothetical protein
MCYSVTSSVEQSQGIANNTMTLPLHVNIIVKPKKSIRFSPDSQVFESFSLSEYTHDEIEMCWWTKKESKKRQRTIVAMLHKAVVESKNNRVVEVISDLQLKTSLTDESIVQDNKDGPKISRHISAFSSWCLHSKGLRGLERFVADTAASHGLWTSFHRRDVAAVIRDTVLRMQTASSSNNFEEIASVYQSQSQAFVEFAHQLGLGDAICVKKL